MGTKTSKAQALANIVLADLVKEAWGVPSVESVLGARAAHGVQEAAAWGGPHRDFTPLVEAANRRAAEQVAQGVARARPNPSAMPGWAHQTWGHPMAGAAAGLGAAGLLAAAIHGVGHHDQEGAEDTLPTRYHGR